MSEAGVGAEPGTLLGAARQEPPGLREQCSLCVTLPCPTPPSPARVDGAPDGQLRVGARTANA